MKSGFISAPNRQARGTTTVCPCSGIKAPARGKIHQRIRKTTQSSICPNSLRSVKPPPHVSYLWAQLPARLANFHQPNAPLPSECRDSIQLSQKELLPHHKLVWSCIMCVEQTSSRKTWGGWERKKPQTCLFRNTCHWLSQHAHQIKGLGGNQTKEKRERCCHFGWYKSHKQCRPFPEAAIAHSSGRNSVGCLYAQPLRKLRLKSPLLKPILSHRVAALPNSFLLHISEQLYWLFKPQHYDLPL